MAPQPMMPQMVMPVQANFGMASGMAPQPQMPMPQTMQMQMSGHMTN